jgi:polyisoprenoid-binding protein YceI
MTLIKHLLPFIALIVSQTSLAATYEVDAAHSFVRFEVKHLGIATVDGKFKQFSGSFSFDEKNVKNSAGTATVQVKSIDTGIEARDNHLRADDFFAAEKFPESTFKTKKIIPGEGGKFQVIGDLSIRNITKEVAFDATYLGKMKGMDGAQRAAFEASTTVNRFDFGLTWMKLVETVPVVGKDVKITIHIQAQIKK